MFNINFTCNFSHIFTNKILTVLARGFALVVILGTIFSNTALRAEETNLPQREGPRPETTFGVPHIQIDVSPDLKINKALLAEVSKLSGVEIRPTVVSLPGAMGFWLNEELQLAHPEVIVGGREFGHMHPNGSLHMSLSPKRANEAVLGGWAIHHPWANKRPGWEGFVMLYSPQSKTDSKIVLQLIIDSYNFVTGEQS